MLQNCGNPDDPAYAAAARRYDRQTAQAQVAVTQAAPAPPLRKVAASATPVFDELRLQSDALFRTGQAGSTWEGMGQYAVAHPDLFEAYVEECRSVHGQPDVRLTKAMAALAPLPNATDTLMARIAKRQAEAPGLSFVEASTQVVQEAPDLHTQYLRASRYPHLRGQPLTKQADPAPTYEAILKQVDAQVATQPGLPRRDALIALVQAHPHDTAYSDAYRRYHVTDGVDEWYAARLATPPTGQ